MLCKKFVVSDGKPLGFVRYRYDENNLLAEEEYLNTKEKKQGKLQYFYTGNRLDSTYFWNAEDRINTKVIRNYNNFDSLIAQTTYTLVNGGYQVEKKEFSYSPQLDTVLVYRNGQLVQIQRYFFYNQSQQVYKILYGSLSSVLDSQSVFSTSAKGFVIERKLDASGKKRGQTTRQFNPKGELVLEEIMGLNNELVQKTEVIFDNSGRVVKKIFTRPNTSLDNFEQFYYY